MQHQHDKMDVDVETAELPIPVAITAVDMPVAITTEENDESDIPVAAPQPVKLLLRDQFGNVQTELNSIELAPDAATRDGELTLSKEPQRIHHFFCLCWTVLMIVMWVMYGLNTEPNSTSYMDAAIAFTVLYFVDCFFTSWLFEHSCMRRVHRLRPLTADVAMAMRQMKDSAPVHTGKGEAFHFEYRGSGKNRHKEKIVTYTSAMIYPYTTFCDVTKDHPSMAVLTKGTSGRRILNVWVRLEIHPGDAATRNYYQMCRDEFKLTVASRDVQYACYDQLRLASFPEPQWYMRQEWDEMSPSQTEEFKRFSLTDVDGGICGSVLLNLYVYVFVSLIGLSWPYRIWVDSITWRASWTVKKFVFYSGPMHPVQATALSLPPVIAVQGVLINPTTTTTNSTLVVS